MVRIQEHTVILITVSVSGIHSASLSHIIGDLSALLIIINVLSEVAYTHVHTLFSEIQMEHQYSLSS